MDRCIYSCIPGRLKGGAFGWESQTTSSSASSEYEIPFLKMKINYILGFNFEVFFQLNF